MRLRSCPTKLSSITRLGRGMPIAYQEALAKTRDGAQSLSLARASNEIQERCCH